MNLDPGQVVIAISRFAVPQIINQAQRNEIVIKVLKHLKLDPANPPKYFDGVYAYALVEYGVDKPKSILKLFREREIRLSFWRGFSLDDIDSFVDTVVHFIDYRDIGDEIIQELGLQATRNIEPNINTYLKEFYQVFTNVARLTRTPSEVMRDKDFRGILDSLNQLSTPATINAKLKEKIGIVPSISPYTIDSKRIIKDRTQSFCGRQFVFDAIKEFINNNPNGYFTVVGYAGMGKSAIAAQYVLDNPGTICFFNIRDEGKNSSELFLEQIRQQLINLYQLQDVVNDDLSNLLTKVREKMSADKKLIIVVDALDEVDQELSGNILYLPTSLPKNVYFLLTRRPYKQNDKRLYFSSNVCTQELDLSNHYENNTDDVKEYIRLMLNNEKYKQGFSLWIKKENINSNADFVEQIAEKSENNFMYLHWILPEIANPKGFYNDKTLDDIPEGLQNYYSKHWEIMGMTTKPSSKNKIKIIYVMSALRRAVSRPILAKYSKQDEFEVQEVLEGWRQFLEKQETYDPPRYRFYHESFRDFLYSLDIVQAAGVNLSDISSEVAKNMTEGLIL